MRQEIRWEEGQVGLVWFGRNCEAEFRTMNDLMNESITKVGIELLGQLKILRGGLVFSHREIL